MPRVLFSVSDPRFLNPSPLYSGLEDHATASHLAVAFSFAGAPIFDLPHPALCDDSGRESLLRDGWVRLRAFCAEFVTPVIGAGKHVVVDGFDLDLLLSVAATASTEERAALEELHDSLAREALGPLGLYPQYFFFSESARREIEEMQAAHAELRGRDDEELYALSVTMNDMRSRYFREHGRLRPFGFPYPHSGSVVQMWSVLNGYYAKQLDAA